MERYRKLLSILVISTIFSTVFAEAPADWFATLGLGYGLNTKPSASSVNNGLSSPDQYEVSSVNNSTLINVGFGKEFLLNSKYFSHYRLSVNYNMATAYKTTGVVDQYGQPGYENYNYTYNVSRQTLLFSYETDIIHYKQWSPHVSVAVGPSSNTASGYSETPCATVDPRTSFSISNHSEYAFAYQLGLGTGYQVMKEGTINLDYQYLNAGQARLGNDTDGNQGPKQTLTSQGLLLSFKYNFAL